MWRSSSEVVIHGCVLMSMRLSVKVGDNETFKNKIMTKKSQKQLLKEHETALKEILAIWKKPNCLHTCRWGNKTVEICLDTLETPPIEKKVD